ncbi:MAG: hypothetical protein IPN67_09555 [Bacteroidales bacterium]|nr:hypothetical protein [Bacteroidales bacterium]MBK8882604.1 hypothetical protein [Bacteroidales bacterium]
MGKILMFFSLLVLGFGSALSQEKPRFLTLNGYLSTMQSAMFNSLSGPFINDNLIHNRLNLKGYVNENITFGAEFRNRLFTGDMVRSVPDYDDMIADDQGWADLSWNILNKQSFFLNTTIDRLWADFNYGKFQARIGRQRINWGQTLVWNPNDIFNTYSFFDFDYIERPGSDAIRLQYFPGYSSAVEFAIKADHENNVTASALYRFNKWGYDIQFLAGYVDSEDLMAGAGWSGSFGSVSFRGEAAWFQPYDNFSGAAGTGIFTFGFDKTFKNNSMAQAQLMICSNPADPESFSDFYFGTLSAKELAFSEFTAFGQLTWPVTPLFNASLSAMWFPDMNGYYAGPSLDFSVAENVDFSLYWQHFDSKTASSSEKINMAFLRVKISF